MHPEIQSERLGTCPKCGMALEPTVATTTEKGKKTELGNMKSRFWFSTVLTIPMVILAMGDVVTGGLVSRWVPPAAKTFFEVALATLVCTWGAWPFYVRAVRSVRNMSLNMFTLVGLGVFVAYTFSLVATLFPVLFPASFRGKNGEVAVYFKAAAVIVTLVLLGQVLELRARGATGNAMERRGHRSHA